MTNIVPTDVYLTLKDDPHDFDTLEILIEPTPNKRKLTNHIDNPEEKYRYKVLEQLRDKSMWKATLSNPNGPPYKVKIGTATIDLNTKQINLDLEMTDHHVPSPEDLTPRDT